MKAQIDELVEKEMGSSTKIKKNYFKMVIRTFIEQIKNIAQEIEDTIQSQKIKTAKSLGTTYLENFLVFQLDDELIPGIVTLLSLTISSIVLGSQSQKQKHEVNSSTKPFADVVFMNNRLKDIAVAFADTYTCSSYARNTQINELVFLVNQVEKKIYLIKNSLEEVKSSLGDIKDTLGSM